jgi:O-antigen ligase
MNKMAFIKFLQKSLPFIYLVFFLSLFCGLRAISSMCEGALLILTIVLTLVQTRQSAKNRFPNYFVGGCLLFYVITAIALFYTNDVPEEMHHIQLKITLIFIPLAFYFNNYLDNSFREKVMPYYILFLALAMFFCIGAAAYNYSTNHDSSVFFYHALVSPFYLHAIQYSIYTFVGLVYLLEKSRRQSYFLNKFFHFTIISCYAFFIILLSSKMVILFAFASILIYIGLAVNNTGPFKLRIILSVIACISILSILMVTNNPVSNRFKDIFTGNINVIEKKEFKSGDYFNGVQFRLLEWKLVGEILTENKAWILGVSPGDAQHLLDQKYKSIHMYSGNENGRRGFLGYNTHNEFLESTLQTGIVGLLCFLVIFVGCIQMMVNRQKTEFWLVGTLLLTYCFLESVFDTQYGILLFTFFPLFLFYTTDKQRPGSSSDIRS